MRPLSVCALALSLALPSSAKTQRHTVLDYYKLLPSRFFEIPVAVTAQDRLRWLHEGLDPKKTSPDNRSIIDLKNDFLRSAGDGAQGRLDLAVFRYHGQETLGVFDDFEEGELSFWRLRNGRLRDVTRSVFPEHLHEVSVELPRKGTTIWIFEGNGYKAPKSKMVYSSFYWSKGHFRRAPG